MEIRKASLLDFSAILVLLSEMQEEAELENVNWTKVSHTLIECIGKGLVLISVDEEQNRITGSIGGDVGTEWYSTEPILGDYWFFVREQYRQTPAAARLITAWKEIGDGGKVTIKMGHVLGGDVERKDKLFERMGFEKLGSLYRKEKANGRSLPADG